VSLHERYRGNRHGWVTVYDRFRDGAAAYARLQDGVTFVSRRRPQSGMFPCFRFGFSSRFVSAVSSAEHSTGRVRRGAITSST
jgi:hypothetical protein